MDTFGPIRQMSLTKWDCIMSDRSWEWLSVLMKFMLLLEGWGCLFPAGTWKNFFRKRRSVVQQLCTIVVKGHYLKGKRICKSIITINQTSTPSLNGAGQSNHWACQIKCFFFYIVYKCLSKKSKRHLRLVKVLLLWIHFFFFLKSAKKVSLLLPERWCLSQQHVKWHRRGPHSLLPWKHPVRYWA